MKIWGLTDRGTVREQNQDTFHLWKEDNTAALLVCDGMGGARAGNVASALAVQAFTEAIQHSDAQPEARLTAALAQANEQVYQRAHQDPDCRGMGTTLVAALVEGNVAHIINVGDSRAYYLSQNGIRQITIDHSLVQDLLQRGHITPEEARNHPNKNVITRALGVDSKLEGDLFDPGAGAGEYAAAVQRRPEQYAGGWGAAGRGAPRRRAGGGLSASHRACAGTGRNGQRNRSAFGVGRAGGKGI